MALPLIGAPSAQDVLDVFANQNMAGLQELRASIRSQMQLGEDPEYWETMGTQCEVEIARATLREIHAQRLQARLATMEEAKRAQEKGRLEEQIRARMREQEQAQQRGAGLAAAAEGGAGAGGGAAAKVGWWWC